VAALARRAATPAAVLSAIVVRPEANRSVPARVVKVVLPAAIVRAIAEPRLGVTDRGN
jgi:hypothetical protein